MSKPDCTMCDDTGFKDHAWLRTEPCDHQTPEPEPARTLGEDFLSQLRRVNGARWAAWAQGDGEDPLYASNEFGGEAGEVQNEVKKLVREQRGWKGSRTTTEKLGEELGDCIVCLDTIARTYGLDLATVTAAKFNKTSEANGFPHRLHLSQQEKGLQK
jgi:NTP pyrophosphatase (non-canonical NTP hydrolase)